VPAITPIDETISELTRKAWSHDCKLVKRSRPFAVLIYGLRRGDAET
jgi:hypothetical protein